MLKVLIFSEDHITGVAIKHFCGENKKEDWCILFTSDIRDVVSIASAEKPDYIVMDILPRHIYYTIYNIRKYNPEMPLVFVNERFLFSDYICADFFGMIVLSDYRSLLELGADFTPYDFIYNEAFSGPFFSGGCILNTLFCKACLSREQLRNEMNLWLRKRLKGIIPSVKCRDYLRVYLNEDLSLCNFQQKKLSNRQQYYYRNMVMRTINIDNFTRDFESSLKF